MADHFTADQVLLFTVAREDLAAAKRAFALIALQHSWRVRQQHVPEQTSRLSMKDLQPAAPWLKNLYDGFTASATAAMPPVPDSIRTAAAKAAAALDSPDATMELIRVLVDDTNDDEAALAALEAAAMLGIRLVSNANLIGDFPTPAQLARLATDEFPDDFTPKEAVASASKGRKQAAKGSVVDVVVRARPLLPGEPGTACITAGEAVTVVEQRERLDTATMTKTVRRNPRDYQFSRIYDPAATTADVYAGHVKPLVQHVVTQHRNASAFCYGYTGTGKSYTILGTDESPGLYLLAAQDLIETVAEANAAAGQPDDSPDRLIIQVSMFENYGKQFYDLLADERSEVFVRADEGGRVCVRGLQYVTVGSVDEVTSVLKRGAQSRQVGSSTVHDASSRSHAVLQFTLTTERIIASQQELASASLAYAKVGSRLLTFKVSPQGMPRAVIDEYLHHQALEATARDAVTAAHAAAPAAQCVLTFVDMAGNDWERADVTQSKLTRAEQAAINSGLLSVKNCLQAVHEGAKHVPYRNSPLTRVLQHQFEAGSRVVMIATVSASDDARVSRQTIDCLNFAQMLHKGQAVLQRVQSRIKTETCKTTRLPGNKANSG